MISLPVFDNTLHWYSFVVFRFFMARFFFCAGAFVVSGYFSSLLFETSNIAQIHTEHKVSDWIFREHLKHSSLLC